MRSLLTLLTLGTVLSTATAYAGDPDPEPPPGPTVMRSAADRAQHHDASIDRGLLSAHAETIGEGKWAINDYELIVLGVTYGITKRFDLTLATLLPVTTDLPLVVSLAPKYVVYRADKTVVALRGWFVYAHGFGSDPWDGGMLTLGLLLDQYFDDGGRFAFHAQFAGGGVFGSDFDGDGLAFGKGAVLSLDIGFSLGVAKPVKLFVEGKIVGAVANGTFTVGDTALISYGVRFHNNGLAGDIGFVRPVGGESNDIADTLILGIPFVSFSARF